MKPSFPQQLNRYPIALDRAARNAAISSLRLEWDDLPYILNEIEKRVGTVDSIDPASLSYRLAQAEATINTLTQVSSTSADMVSNGILLGTQNGSNTSFSTLSDFATGTTKLYLNGQRITLGEDYTESGATGISMTVAPLSGDVLRIDYVKG
jgi:hypothetical protein